MDIKSQPMNHLKNKKVNKPWNSYTAVLAIEWRVSSETFTENGTYLPKNQVSGTVRPYRWGFSGRDSLGLRSLYAEWETAPTWGSYASDWIIYHGMRACTRWALNNWWHYVVDYEDAVETITLSVLKTQKLEEGGCIIPELPNVEQNYPNPLDPLANITFNLSVLSIV